MSHTYPPALVPVLKDAWEKSSQFSGEKRPSLPADEPLQELLSTAYHTSLLKEEGRRLTFHLVVLTRGEQKDRRAPHENAPRTAEFAEARSFSVAELRRLAPAAETVRSMICVELDAAGRWQIWGLLDTGSNWWEYIHHEADRGTPPPVNLTVTSAGPGELVISSEGFVLVSLRSGSIYFPQRDVLSYGPIADYLEPVRKSLYRDTLKALKAKEWDPRGHVNDYPMRFFNFCLSRILTGIRDKGHRGTLILLPDEISARDSRLTDRVNIKYPCKYNYAWDLMVRHLELHRKYYDDYSPLWDEKKPVDPERFRKLTILGREREEVDEALADCFHFAASLSAVDGALIMTQRLSILGFGAEVVAQSRTLKDVDLAANAAATETRPLSIEAYGTRHRSAFRFCSSYEDSVAFVVSQDGGIRATKRIGARMVMWPDIRVASFGL